VENIGLYFITTAIVSIASRLMVGRFVDHGAREALDSGGERAPPSSASRVLVFASSLGMFLVGAVVTSFGSSLAQPALSALAIDLADRSPHGKSDGHLFDVLPCR